MMCSTSASLKTKRAPTLFGGAREFRRCVCVSPDQLQDRLDSQKVRGRPADPERPQILVAAKLLITSVFCVGGGCRQPCRRHHGTRTKNQDGANVVVFASCCKSAARHLPSMWNMRRSREWIELNIPLPRS